MALPVSGTTAYQSMLTDAFVQLFAGWVAPSFQFNTEVTVEDLAKKAAEFIILNFAAAQALRITVGGLVDNYETWKKFGNL